MSQHSGRHKNPVVQQKHFIVEFIGVLAEGRYLSI